MGRQLLRVPPNWQHPKTTRYDYRLCKDVEGYKPLSRDYEAALADFEVDVEKQGLEAALKDHGGGPLKDDYLNFEGVEPTWWQVYETVSEGTPVTPPFATREELVEYLVENGDFWDQQRRAEGPRGGFQMPCEPWSGKSAEAFVMGSGWAPSMVISGGVVRSGVGDFEAEPEGAFVMGSAILLLISLLAFSAYVSLAFSVFQYRNPTANQMSFYRDFESVISFQKLDKYQ